MKKSRELSDPTSCINRAFADEWLFVLRGKDPCASEVIRYWVRLRVETGMNKIDDPKIQEALQCAREMAAQSIEINGIK